MAAIDNAASIGIRVYANIGDLVNDLNRAGVATDRFSQRARSAGDGIGIFISKTQAAAIAVGLLIKKSMDLSDQWTNLTNRTRLLTESQEKAAALQRLLYASAQQLAVPIDDISAAYARVDQAVKAMGVSQEESLRTTQGLIAAFKSFGSGGREATEVVRQLGQGLSAGRLNGDELRAVLEGSTAVADAIAKKFGIARGELKKWGEEGKLDAKRVFEALSENAQIWSDDFAKRIPTFADSFQRLETAAARFSGVIYQWSNSPSIVGQALGNIVDIFDAAANSIQSGQFGMLVGVLSDQFSSMEQRLAPTLEVVQGLFSMAGAEAAKLFSDNWYKVIPLMEFSLQTFTDKVMEWARNIGNAANVVFTTIANSFSDNDAEVRAAMQEYEWGKKVGLSISEQNLELAKKTAETEIAAAEKKIKLANDTLELYKINAAIAENSLADKRTAAAAPGKGLTTGDFEMKKDPADIAQKLATEQQAAFDDMLDRDIERDRINAERMAENSRYAAEMLRSRYNEERAITEEHYKLLDELEMAHREGAIATDEEYNKIKRQINTDHFYSQLDAAANYGNAMAALTGKQYGENAQIAVAGLQKSLGALATHSKTAFELNKKFALADAIVSTAQGVAAGVRLGWPMAIPAVAYALATGGAQIASIRKSSFNGGGSVSSGGGGSAAGVSAPPQAAAQAKVLRVEGLNTGALFDSKVVKGLTQEVANFLGDGGGKVSFE